MFPLLLPLQILFILVDSNLKSNERVLSFFKLKKSQLPALAIFHTPDEEHDVLSLDEVSVQRVQDFCNRFLQRMQKVKGDSCTVCRKPGSCRMMRLLTKLLQKMILVPSATPYPCHLLFHFCLHLNIGKVLDLGQSRDECVCRASLLIDLYLLICSKTSLVSAAVWRSQWSIYFLGRASEIRSEGCFWTLRMGVVTGGLYERIRETVAWIDMRSIKKATKQSIQSELYQRSLLGGGQFNLCVHSVLRVVLCQNLSSYSIEALCVQILCCVIEMG